MEIYNDVAGKDLTVKDLLYFVSEYPEDNPRCITAHKLQQLVYDRIWYTAWYTKVYTEELPSELLQPKYWLASDLALVMCYKHVATTASQHPIAYNKEHIKQYPAEQYRKKHVIQYLTRVLNGLTAMRKDTFRHGIDKLENLDYLLIGMRTMSRLRKNEEIKAIAQSTEQEPVGTCEVDEKESEIVAQASAVGRASRGKSKYV